MNYKLYFTTENPVLIPLSAQSYEKAFTQFSYADCKQLNSNFAKAINAIHFALTNQNLEDEDGVFAIKSNQGAFSRIYPPALNLDPNGENDYILSFGGKQIPLNYQRDKKGTPNKKGILQSAVEGFELEGSFKVADSNGFKENVFQLSLLHEEKDIMIFMNCAIRYTDEMLKEENREALKALDTETLTASFKRDPASLKGVIGFPVKFDKFEGDTIKMNNLPIGDYSLIGYRSIPTQYGVTNLLTVQGAVDENGSPTQTYKFYGEADSDEFEVKPLEVVQVWSTSNINTVLTLEPEITPEKPAVLKVVAVDQGKKKDRAVCTLLVETKRVIDKEELNFDF